jgi:hypothetical protein
MPMAGPGGKPAVRPADAIEAAVQPGTRPPVQSPAESSEKPAVAPGRDLAASEEAIKAEAGGDPLKAALAAEEVAYAILYRDMSSWKAENVRELARMLHTLPDSVAAQILWLAASAPETVDIGPIFTAALSSPSAVIRGQAVDILANLHPPELRRRLLLGLLRADGGSKAVLHSIDGRAAKPFPSSVRSLMEVMELLEPAQKEVAAAVAARLKNLTRVNVPATAEAWRDWWKANSRQYD